MYSLGAIISLSLVIFSVYLPAGWNPVGVTSTDLSMSCQGSTFLEAPSFPIGSEPQMVVAADFDSDGRPDIATANLGMNRISIARNIGGAGTHPFGPETSFDIGSPSYDVLAGDLDNDGKPDLIGMNSSGPISVFRNMSTGIGNIAFAPRITVSAASPVRSSVMADFNGDGRLDVALLAFQGLSSGLAVLTNTSTGPGSITFAAPIVLPTLAGTYSIATGDFNADGKVDLVAPNFMFLSIYRNTSSSSIAFASRQDFETPYSGGVGTTVSDADGDGKADIIATGGGLVVYRNTTIGSSNITFAEPVFVGGFSSRALIVQDLDGDGKGDAATLDGQNNVVVLRNLSVPGSLSFASRKFFGVGRGSGGLALADFDLNGKPDLIVTNSDPFANSASFLRNIGESAGDIRFFSRIILPLQNGEWNPWAIAVADIDDDDLLDLITANNSGNNFSVLRNVGVVNGLQAFSQSIAIAGLADSSPYAIVSGDFDNDGRLDVAIANSGLGSVSIFRNISSGSGVVSFSPPLQATVGNQPQNLEVGDFNNDGKVDLVSVNNGSSSVSILRNISPSPGLIDFAPRSDLALQFGAGPAVSADLDADGRQDLAVAESSGTLSIFLNSTNSTDTIQFQARVGIMSSSSLSSIAVTDFDGDLKKDIAVASVLQGNEQVLVSVRRNTTIGSGQVSFAPPLNIQFPYYFATKTSLAALDLDRDSRTDLAVGGMSGGMSLYRNTGSAGTLSFIPNGRIEASGVMNNISTSDLNGDGARDIVSANYNSSTIGVFINPCEAGTTPTPTNTPTATPTTTPTATPTATPLGFEGDSAPRPDGDGQMVAGDVVQARRFVAGLDTINAATNEFQRADSAPRSTFGDGALSSADVVQARRYAAALDPPTNAGGPTVVADPELRAVIGGSLFGAKVEGQGLLRLASGKGGAVGVELASGREVAAVSFRVKYEALGKPLVSLGDLPDGAVLTVNDSVEGELTILIDSAGAFGAVGKGFRLVEISFAEGAGNGLVEFDGAPSVSDQFGNEVLVLPVSSK